MNWLDLLQHSLLFVLVCFIATIVVAAYHEDAPVRILRSAARRTVTLTIGVGVLVGIMLILELLFTYTGE